MKPGREQIEGLSAVLRALQQRRGLSLTEIGQRSGVHAGQVSRILAGDFRTYSDSVVQICMVLGAPLPRATQGDVTARGLGEGQVSPSTDRAAERLQRQILTVWDGTHADAERLTAFLRQLATLRRVGGAERS